MKRAKVYWFTGLSGSGKTTIVEGLVKILKSRGKKVKIYDGDAVRAKLNKHLQFTPQDIIENNRIISQLCMDNIYRYDYIFTPIISPFSVSRENARKKIGDSFYLIYVKASLPEAMRRDTKGLYKEAMSGKIKNFIGIDENVPYEAPINADLILDTEHNDAKECISKLLKFIETNDKYDNKEYHL